MAELLARLAQLTFEELVERAMRNHELLRKVKPTIPTANRANFEQRSHHGLVEIVARQERILIHEGLINNAERVVTPT